MHLTRHIHPVLVSIIALFSLTPLQLLIFGDDTVVLQGQLAGIMYTMILIAFFAGAQWNNALQKKIPLVHITSLTLAVIPWFLILARRFFNEEVLWSLMCSEVLIILAIDWLYFRKHYPRWYFLLRNIVTILLSTSIAIICIRKSIIY